MHNKHIHNVLRFMHTQDRNGGWLTLLQEIESGGSDFNPDHITETLQQWHIESGDNMYLDWIAYVNTIKEK